MGKVIQNFRRSPVLRTDELTPNLAPTIDSVSVRKNEGSVKRVALPLGIADGQEIDLVPGKKLSIGAVILVHIHAQHEKLRHLALQLVERGNLLHTRSAPTRPEVEQHHFAAVIA